MPRWSYRLSIALALIATAGCGERVYKVQGKVTWEGKPLPGGGSISFVPLGNDRARPAGGTIGEDGMYELSTTNPGDGAVVGEFRVVISQVTEKEPKNLGDDGKPAPRTGLSLPLADRIPENYADHYNSPLTAKVEAKSPNEINFHLKRE